MVSQVSLMRGKSLETQTNIGAATSILEDKAPPGMDNDGKWAWKIAQLRYQTALEGTKRWGRERKTAYTYAKDADKAGFGKVAQALRERKKWHEKCEELAFNGILTQLPYTDLQTELNDIELKLQRDNEDWPPAREKNIVFRQCKEAFENPAAVKTDTDKFMDVVSGWSLPGDLPHGGKFTATFARNRSRKDMPEGTTSFFLELFTSCVAKPLIERGATSHQDFLAVLSIMKLEIDTTSDDPSS